MRVLHCGHVIDRSQDPRGASAFAARFAASVVLGGSTCVGVFAVIGTNAEGGNVPRGNRSIMPPATTPV
jgi:hypothetical protein